jgi:hypothetical protein
MYEKGPSLSNACVVRVSSAGQVKDLSGQGLAFSRIELVNRRWVNDRFSTSTRIELLWDLVSRADQHRQTISESIFPLVYPVLVCRPFILQMP